MKTSKNKNKKNNLLKGFAFLGIVSAVVIVPIVTTTISNNSLIYYWGFNMSGKDLSKNVNGIKQSSSNLVTFYDSRSFNLLTKQKQNAIQYYFDMSVDEVKMWLDGGKQLSIAILEINYQDEDYYRISQGGEYGYYNKRVDFKKKLDDLKFEKIEPHQK